MAAFVQLGAGRLRVLPGLLLALLVMLPLVASPTSGACTCTQCRFGPSPEAGDAQRERLVASPARDNPGEGGLDLRYDTFIMTAHAAWSYALATGQLPSNVYDLGDYIFFAPTCTFTRWEVSGDVLTIAAEVLPLEPRELAAAIPRPGSAAWEQEVERQRKAEFEAFHRRPVDPSVADVSAQDVLEGRYSNYIRDRLQAFARDEREFRQLYWAWQLAGFLHAALRGLKNAHGTYPASAAELLAALPARSANAWIAPMTGERVGFSDGGDGPGIVYRPVNGGTGFELLVPLFGAGAEHALGENKHRFLPSDGYFPGQYFRRAEGTGDDTPLSYGL